MPISYSIDAARGIITTRCQGNLTLDEVMGHFDELSKDPRCPEYLSVLLDLSESDGIPNSPQLHVVVDAIRSLQERVKFEACAIVASRDAMYGMARMFSVFAEPYFRSIAVFRQTGQASTWLWAQCEQLARARRQRA